MAESGTRQRVRGTVYFVQEMFQTRHDGSQSSGVTHAQRKTQSVKIELPTDARYFPLLLYSRLHRASTPSPDINNRDRSTASPDCVQLYPYIESRGTVVSENCDKTPVIQVKLGS